MNRQKELAKNTFIIALGKICTQFVSFFLLPVYTHNLSTAEYGTIDLVITCTSLIAPILSLQLERAVFRFLIDARKNHVEQKKILSTVFSTIAYPILITAILCPLASLMFGFGYWPYITLMLIASIISNVTLQVPRGLGKNIHFSIGSMIVGIVNALTSIIAILVFHKGIEWVFIGNILSHIVGFIYIFLTMKLFREIRPSLNNAKKLKEMLKFSIPMIPNDISYWVISVSDRALIFAFLGDSANGIYAAATKIPTVLVTAWNVFNMSWMETVSAHAKDEDAGEFISNTANSLVKLFSSICLCAIAVVPFVFPLLIGENFAEAYDYIPVLIIGAFYNIIIGLLSSVYIGFKKTSTIAKTTTLAAILNAGINFAFIKTIGVWAAVISTVLAYVFVSIYRLYDINKTVKIKIRPTPLLFSTVILMVSTVLYTQGEFVSDLVNLAFAIIVSISVNFDLIKTVIRKANLKLSRKDRK